MNFFQAKLIDGKIETSGNLHASFGKKNGIGIEWIWNENKLTLKNDPYGFYPVYYYSDNTSLIISPSVSNILRLVPKIEFDDNSFSVLLRQGWLIENDTAFKGIRALSPNSVLTWHMGKLSIETKKIPMPKISEIKRDEAIEIYARLFQNAIEKNLPDEDDKIALPLSGGRDSRHILFALNKAGRKPDVCLTAVHPPPRPNEDARIASLLCEALNIKHQLIEQPDSRFRVERKKNELTGFTVTEHGWFLALADYVNKNYNVIYDGIAGDVLSAGLFLDKELLELFREENFKELANKILLPEGFIEPLLTPENYKRFSREKAMEHLLGEIFRYAEHPNPVGAFYFWNRTRRCIAVSPFRLFDDSITVKTPYLDEELFDFLYSLPAEMLLDHQFHTDTIAFAYPEFSNIPYEKKVVNPVNESKSFKRFSREVLRLSMTKRNRKLVSRNFLLTRCLRCIFDKNYSPTISEFGDLATLLLQLERL